MQNVDIHIDHVTIINVSPFDFVSSICKIIGKLTRKIFKI